MDLNKIKNKIILVQNSYHPTPHLETELEVIEQLIKQNNTVYYINCNSNIKSCFANPLNRNLTCLNCISRVNNGINHLLENTNSKNLKRINYEYFTNLNVNQYLDDYVFSSIEDLRMLKYKKYDIGLAVLSSLVSFCKDHKPNLAEHKNIINNLVASGKFLYDFFEILFKELKFDYVFLFNGRFNENRPLLRVCQLNNINFFTHERGGLLNKYLLLYNNIPHSLSTTEFEINKLWETAEDNRVDIGTNFFIKRRKNIEESWYSFTKEQITGLLPTQFDQKKFNITIFNSSLDEYEGFEGFGPYFYKDDNEGINMICKSLINYSNIKIYLRVHPNISNKNSTQMIYIKDILSKHKNLTIINPDEKIDSYELMKKSDLILSFGSTIGVEAAFFKKNVILLARAVYQNLGCVYIPNSHIELIELIINNDKSIFDSINYEAAIKYGYWQEKMGIFYQYYTPTNVSTGKFKGKLIQSNFILKYLEISYNRILRQFKWKF